jgi:hypothetical protein
MTEKLFHFLFIGVLLLAVLSAVGPVIVALANALVPLIIVGGLVVGALRLVWHFTDRY